MGRSISVAPSGKVVNTTLILWAATLGGVLFDIDTILFPTIAPSLAKDFATSQAMVSLLSSIFIVTLAAFILGGGTLGDMYGRKRLMLFGIALEGTMAVLAMIAPSFWILFIIRALAGVGAALISPLSIAIINAFFAPEERPKAMGLYVAVSGLSIGVAGILFQLVNQEFGWRATLVIIVLVGIAAFAMLSAIPESTAGQKHRVDWIGIALAGVGLVLLVVGISQIGGAGGLFSPTVFLTIGGGLLALIVLIFYDNRQPYPALQVSLLTRPIVLVGALLALFGFLVQGGVSFELNLYLQSLLHITPLHAGLYLLPMMLAAFLVSLFVGLLTKRFSTLHLVIGALLLMAAGMIVLALIVGLSINFLMLLVSLVLVGSGFVIANNLRINLIVGSAPQELSGAASAIGNAIANLGAALGITIPAVLFTSLGTRAYYRILTRAGATPAQIKASIRVLKDLVDSNASNVSAQYGITVQQVQDLGHAYARAYILGLSQIFWILAATLVVIGIVVFALLKYASEV